MNTLRVMLVSTSMMRGGAEAQVVALAHGLRRRGHAVHVVSLRDPQGYTEVLAEAGVPVTSLHMRRRVPDPRGLLRLARAVRAWRPDVVHAHMVHANLLARLARPLAWAPLLVSTAHNVDEGPRWRELAYRATDALGDLTTNVADAAVERFVRVGAVPAHRIVAMRNGLDVDAYARDPVARAQLRAELELGDGFAWIAVGRLELQKDLPTLLEAFAHPEGPRGVLLVVGDGPDREALLAHQAQLGLTEGRVRWLGGRSDVPALLSAADGYVMSSAWEGLPMVLLEASSASLPIVATDVGGNREVVQDGVAGHVVPPHDPVALAAAMVRIEALPPGARDAMGAAGHAYVSRHYRIDAVVAEWEALYLEYLAARSPRQAGEVAR